MTIHVPELNTKVWKELRNVSFNKDTPLGLSAAEMFGQTFRSGKIRPVQEKLAGFINSLKKAFESPESTQAANRMRNLTQELEANTEADSDSKESWDKET